MVDISACISKHPHPAIDLSKWQKTVDLMANLYGSVSGCIVQLRNEEFNVIASSASQGNFLKRDNHWPLDADTFCKKVIETDRYLYSGEPTKDNRWCDTEHVKHGPVRSYLGFPVHWPDSEIFGTICVIDTKATHYNQHMIELLGQLALLIEADLKQMLDHDALKQLSITDELTGIYNRRGFMAIVSEYIKAARFLEHDTGFIYLDIDCLKQLNDNFGHDKGDEMISSLGDVLRTQCRESDICSRIGGDEFVIFLQNVNQQEMTRVVGRVESGFKKKIAELGLDENEGYGISFGTQLFDYDDQSALECRLAQTDKLMYANKAFKKKHQQMQLDKVN